MRLELQKEQLMAFVVHDLKNPVNSMDLHAQLLLRDRDLPPRALASAQHIREEARSLLRLVRWRSRRRGAPQTRLTRRGRPE